MKEEKGVKLDVDLTAEDLKTLAEQFKAEYKEKIGTDFPSDRKRAVDGSYQSCIPFMGQPKSECIPS